MAGFVIVRDRKQNIGGAGTEMVAVFAVLLSVFAAYDSVFKTEMVADVILGILLGVVLVLGILVWNGKHLGRKGIFLLLFTGIAAFLGREQFLEGIAPFVNRYIEQRNLFYCVEQPGMEEAAGTAEAWIVLSGILLLMGLVLTIVLRIRRHIILVLPVILFPVLLAATVGHMPSASAVWGMLAAGSLYLIVYHGKKGVLPVWEGVAAAVILAMLYLCSLAVQPRIQNYKEAHLKEYEEVKEAIVTSQTEMLNVRQLIEDGINRDSNYVQSGIGKGDLKNLAENQPQGTEELEITITERPESSVYLRAYAGTTYTGEEWKELPALTLMKRLSSGERRELMNEPFARIGKGDNSIEVQQMKIRILGAEPEYGYAPYYAEVPKGSSVRLDACIEGKGRADREYTYYPRKQAENLSGDALGDTSELWKTYEEFVQETYREYPEDLEGLADWCATIDDTSVETVADVIDKRFASHFRYSLTPGQKPEGQDFTEYFLLENYRGFCVHFATAATLIYRECGYPARYVEGYVVSPDAFRKQEDGTYRAVVTDDMAHAWCETFDSETGWRVREHTLPYVAGSRGEGAAVENRRQDTESLAEESGEKSDVPNTDKDTDDTDDANDARDADHDAVGQNQSDTGGTDHEGGTDNGGNTEDGSISGGGHGPDQTGNDKGVMDAIRCIGRIVGTVLILAGVFAVLCVVQQKIRRQKKQNQFRVRRDGKGMTAIYNEVCDICTFAGMEKHSGMDKKGMDDRECQTGQEEASDQKMLPGKTSQTERQMLEWMKAEFPQMTEEEWEWLYECAVRAAFAEEGVSREEEKECYILYRRFRKEILNGLKGWRKFWFRYGRVL